MRIFPSLISSPLLSLQTTLNSLDNHCDGYHIDVMDDHFVPNLTWGPAFVNAIRQATKLPLHVHLMVDNPADWPERLQLHTDDTLIIHYESATEEQLPSLIKLIKKQQCNVGIALNPSTPIDVLEPYIIDCDYILLMSVNPGFSGQLFIPDVLQKVIPLKQLCDKANTRCEISMDGGINLETISAVAQAGVDSVAAAAAIFFTDDYQQALKELYHQATLTQKD
jgi:ribulose-phosphate 3-epimerase